MLRHSWLARFGVVSLLAVGALAACGSDDDDASESTAAAASATTAAAADTVGASETTTAGSTHEEMVMVTVDAVDYAFEDLPDTVSAGTMLSLTKSSEAELHELVAFRLPDEEQRPVEELIALPAAELEALFVGEPATVLIAPPGEAGFPALGDGTLTEPGRYAIMCFIPIGIDPAEYLAAVEAAGGGPPQIEDAGPPHFTAGMWAELAVE